jgi:conjugative transfer signal peptidase TraF
MNAGCRLTLAACAVGLAMGSSYAAGLRWNTTPSMPMGLWRVETLAAPIQRGDIVTLCLPPAAANLGRDRGYLTGGECPGDVEMLIKPVVAVDGDTVVVSDAGVSVNGTLLADSKPQPRDEAGRPVSAADQGLYRVGADEVWVISGHDLRSYDSRYYGAVPRASLHGRARPILVQ